jgi:hypothetical protein
MSRILVGSGVDGFTGYSATDVAAGWTALVKW